MIGILILCSTALFCGLLYWGFIYLIEKKIEKDNEGRKNENK